VDALENVPESSAADGGLSLLLQKANKLVII